MSTPAKRERTVLSPGTVLDDRFKVLDFLGAGSFGVVYRAQQLVFGEGLREVALKLFDSASLTPTTMQELFSDAVTLIRLQEETPRPEVSRHMIQVYDLGVLRTPAQRAFMSMKLVPGKRTLETAVRRFRDAGGMPLETALGFLRQLLVPLAWMHTLDDPVVHGDLKPDNVLLSGPSDLVVVTDFGLAAPVLLGTAGGEIHYQAPETLLGQPGGPPSDIYGVGLIWYEMLTGRNPFMSVEPENGATDQASVIRALQQARKWPIRAAEPTDRPGWEQRIPPASEINEELRDHPQLESMLNRCLAYLASQRYGTARALLDDLDQYVARGKVTVHLPPSAAPEVGNLKLLAKTPASLVEDSRNLLAQGRAAEALLQAEGALRQNPKLLDALLATARAHAKMGQLAKARETCARAQGLAPRDPQVLLAMADVLEAEGNAGLARALRQQASTQRR